MNIVNIIIKVAVVCIAADIIYETNQKHNLTGKIKAKFSKK
jgi:hypothetical protein